MHQGKYVFNQVISFLSQYEFNGCVDEFEGDHRVKILSCWQQFLVMTFGQLGKRESLRDICICLFAHQKKLYHLGLSGCIKRITLRDANEKRDYRIYEKFAYILIAKARKLYVDDPEFTLELDGVAYALDSTTIELCMALFPWAKFRTTKAGIKLHTLLDFKGSIPAFIHITDARVSDVKVLDVIVFEPGAFYVMDRGYLDFARLYAIHVAGSFFVTRAKDNTKIRRLYSRPITDEEKRQGIRCDQIVVLSRKKARKDYPEKLRRIKYYDAEHDQYYVFLTNNFRLPALIIAELYRYRWRVELFFKWIKQHLKVQSFWGYSENAVKTQIWIAMASYALVAIVKKKLELTQSMNEILQILSISLFDKTALKSLFSKCEYKPENDDYEKQLQLAIF
jgi:hypothetical protein